MFSRFIALVISLVSLLCDFYVSSCDTNCSDKPVFTPSRLVVKHGDSASATCSVCQSACKNTLYGLEKSVGRHTINGTTVSWEVDSLTEWGTELTCYYSVNDTEVQCCSILPITVYKSPDSVSISINNHTGPMFEGRQYTLQCEVQNVAPVKNLSVTFYRGTTPLGQQQSFNNNNTKPADEQYTFTITISKEDDGVQYWCEAELELGPEGPQPPPVVKSENITTTVHYKPHLKGGSDPRFINITEGEQLGLDCSAVGNPSPSYTWTFPGNQPFRKGSILTINSVTPADEGKYICSVSNSMGTVTVTFHVIVHKPPYSVSISIANHTGPMIEGRQYTLLCTVQNAVKNVNVTFYRREKPLVGSPFNNTPIKPVYKLYTLTIIPRKEDDGVQYRCEAKLELSPEDPPVKSQHITAIVHYKPHLEVSSHSYNITVTKGDPLHLNCSAVGNPTPTYTWTLPSDHLPQLVDSSVLTIKSAAYEHGGTYTCSARNTAGGDSVLFNVKVRGTYIPNIMVAVVVFCVLVLICVSVGCIHCYKRNRMGQYNLKDVFHLHKLLIPVFSP
uniref:Ig-like domain-containing protein n=1 Tax=Anabas testudineus TaxID=64144 RepID=A0A3Q1HHZ9_ANATE